MPQRSCKDDICSCRTYTGNTVGTLKRGIIFINFNELSLGALKKTMPSNCIRTDKSLLSHFFHQQAVVELGVDDTKLTKQPFSSGRVQDNQKNMDCKLNETRTPIVGLTVGCIFCKG